MVNAIGSATGTQAGWSPTVPSAQPKRHRLGSDNSITSTGQCNSDW